MNDDKEFIPCEDCPGLGDDCCQDDAEFYTPDGIVNNDELIDLSDLDECTPELSCRRLDCDCEHRPD